jgi:hypothetical protein
MMYQESHYTLIYDTECLLHNNPCYTIEMAHCAILQHYCHVYTEP